ncbi:hypothetical protein AQ619_04880 [Caulobacter henricii]|uniref:Sulfotransferase n=1 Tax=Caulobacter henricii TaxID=69395 RepID=A0A0P0NY73_9CAUL|nr:hypothetical protein AQ619_04880 [Caulobacter henricii]
MAHALLCTAPDVGHYHPEVSFFRGYMTAYRNGKASWAGHTRAYFKDLAEFQDMSRTITDIALRHVWRVVGGKRTLCVKDPHLTPFFPDLHELYPTKARFVTICRNPLSVVRSRQAVHEKSGASRPYSQDDVAAVCREYLGYYAAVLRHDFQGQHQLVRYEDLDAPHIHASLATLMGVPGFDLTRLWSSAAPRPVPDIWGTEKHLGPLNLNPRLPPLRADWEATARSICAPIMARLGY